MMASRKKSDDSSRSVSKNSKRHVGVTAFLSSSSSSSEEEEVTTTGCRSCRNTSKEYISKNRDEPDSQPEQETSRVRTEENSLSFKHFLKNGSQTNFQNSGARPKVYFSPSSTSNAYPVEKGPGPYNLEKVYSRNPTELPDFVQDHLVIEQYYLNPERKQQADSDIDNLPDFALNSVRKTRITKKLKEKVTGYCDLSTDGNWDKYVLPRQNQSVPNTSCNTHFFAEPSVGSSERPESSGFPLDLPISANETNSDANAAVRDCCSHPGTSEEANVPKSLPDFLNDGPIRNRAADSENVQDISESTVQRILLENEILRHGLQIAHNQIDEKKERIRSLEAELASRKEMEHEETVHLEKAMEQVEDNLKHNARRVVNAESTILSLKKEIKSLTVEISLLRWENDQLRATAATNTRNDRAASSNSVDQTARRLAEDLRNAASTAEVSLRQLLSGVDNLRVLASAVENVDRIEDRTKDFLPDFDPDNAAAGPAL
ncbi:uncharacterized protein LOC108626544 [Ceratina calcarata]|uniref:Endosome-associated-trafficking regulator 1 n=1 Tax=Ceratina calcarata TaxID=156304 RepID=A0AAJ7N8E9_9HYME|nr:uncharacterized protein LOC108626544 [Ceratina calcarata]